MRQSVIFKSVLTPYVVLVTIVCLDFENGKQRSGVTLEREGLHD